jgi:hypothetical protein
MRPPRPAGAVLSLERPGQTTVANGDSVRLRPRLRAGGRCGSVARHMAPGANRDGAASGRARALISGALAALAAGALGACSTVDPYEITCRELVTSPDKLRETTLKLADKNVKAKVRYERELMRICETAPKSYRPAQRVKPEQ